MKLTMFSVHDSKTELFIQPFYALTPAAGVRMFAQASNDAETQFNKHAADFTLFELGVFDQSTGTVELHPSPVSHGLAISHVDHHAEGLRIAREG